MRIAKCFQVSKLFVIPSRSRLANMQSVSLSMLLHYQIFVGILLIPGHCSLFIPIGDFVLNAEGTVSNLAGAVWMCLLVYHCSFWWTSSLANGNLCFLFKSPWLFNCGCWVRFNSHLLYIFKFVLVYIGRSRVKFWFFFLCSWSCFMSTFVACVSFFFFFFFGRICSFIFCWVVFGNLFIKSFLEFYGICFNVVGLFYWELLCPSGWICWIIGMIHLLAFLV